MKVFFHLPTDNNRHRYCQNCFSENVHDEITGSKTLYKCVNCGKSFDRLIDIDPALSWWIDEKTKEYWHESVGVFVMNSEKEFLFLERTIFPYGFTIPSGHLEKGENPLSSAKRELNEEAGLLTKELVHFETINITTDPCRRGADCHRWHTYTYFLEKTPKITSDPNEGQNPVWLTLSEALSKKLTPPVKYILEKYGQELIRN